MQYVLEKFYKSYLLYRYFYASMCNVNGIPIDFIIEQLGHFSNAQKSARRRTRSGGPRTCADRSGAEKIELSSPGLDSKKAAIQFGITAFSRARDGDRTRDPLLGKEVLHR